MLPRSQRHKKKKMSRKILAIEIILLCTLALFIYYGLETRLFTDPPIGNEVSDTVEEPLEDDITNHSDDIDNEESLKDKVTKVIKQANALALGYDYEEAISLLQVFTEQFGPDDDITKALSGYHLEKERLVSLGAYDSINQISHVFFHSLIADTAKAFDGDFDSNGYNFYMTTVSEFKEMMTEMYHAGYVLVSIHDVARKETVADGSVQFVPGDIMLPPDKKPFVLSQDDVNYYNYMDGDGFAS
ncbi:MAG: hypothetical protein K0Q87_4513, partial [Neobacillus sp.]|nr:hypothetical protein [Neobacillus sp.]